MELVIGGVVFKRLHCFQVPSRSLQKSMFYVKNKQNKTMKIIKPIYNCLIFLMNKCVNINKHVGMLFCKYDELELSTHRL